MKKNIFITISFLFYTSLSYAQFNFWFTQVSKCLPNFHREVLCVSNTKVCTIANGTGLQTWSTTTRSWNTCTVQTCNSGYSNYNNACELNGIAVTSATYGTNCSGISTGNWTSKVAGYCNTKTSCSFDPYQTFGSVDPAVGCPKNLSVSYKCTGVPKSYSYTSGEAGNRSHTISCP